MTIATGERPHFNGTIHLINSIQSGSHPVSSAPSLGVKPPGREADHSPPSSDEVNNAWRYTSILQCAFMAWCSIKVQGQI